MNSPFSQIAHALVKRGFSVVPIIPGGKAPADYRNGEWFKMPDWNMYAQRMPSEAELYYWSSLPGAGIGVVLGELSGIVAVDFDYDIDGLHAQIESMIPESPVKKRGAKGYTAFYRYNGECSGKWQRNKQTVVELLSDRTHNGTKAVGHQTVLPPTIHPDGMTYEWLTEETLLDMEFLPSLPAEFPMWLDHLFGKNQPIVRPVTDLTMVTFGPADYHTVEQALHYIDPDGDYHTWVEVGMAIKTEFGDGGFDLWDQWSARGSKYKAKEMASKWRSFRRHEKKIASVFYFAQQCGYVNVPEYAVDRVGPALGVEIESGGNLSFLRKDSSLPESSTILLNTHVAVENHLNGAENVKNEDELSKNVNFKTGNSDFTTVVSLKERPHRRDLAHINRSELIQAPGVLGHIVNWITETAIFPQPWLAMAGAIALMGVAKGHRVALGTGPGNTEPGLRTNVYTMGVAGSGMGKEHARRCVNRLLYLSNQSLLQGGTPKSDAGLYQSVKKGNGRRILQIDEFGKILSAMTAKGAVSHLQGIPTMMMQLFTSSQDTFLGGEYADADGKRGRVDIDQPCLVVHATTAPDRLYEAMTSTDAVDGFLSRWLIFETKDFVLDAVPGMSIERPPSIILDTLEYWRDEPSNANPRGNLDVATAIRPRVIQFTPEAERLMKAFQRQMRLQMKYEMDHKTRLDPLYARTAEHAAKLALIAFDGDVIDAATFEWAAEMALSRTDYLALAVAENIADNHHEGEIKRILKLIRDAGDAGITQTVLTRKTQFLANKKRRSDILQDLIDSEQVEAEVEETTGRPKVTYRIAKPTA